MQCVFCFVKGTRCVFGKGGAVATCSKWPKLQIFNTKHLIRQAPERGDWLSLELQTQISMIG